MEGKIFQDRYRLIERIGSGGMADVYKAEDIVLSRTVALKVLYRSLAEDPNFVERFRREARSAASLSHPNIVAIYDWGAEDSTYFIVMEYIQGETLKNRLRGEGSISQREVVRIGKEVASALSYAHRKGVVHRDIKPHNIMITPDGQIKVTDFGIARVGTSTITQTGTIMGTAHYISPEQAKGLEVSPASDIYSLGIVLYEMVTGQLPFRGDNPVSVALKQIEERPVLPSLIDRSITVDLENVIMKCLAKDEQLRYKSSEELMEDLERVGRGAPVAPVQAETTMVIPQPLAKEKPKGEAKHVLATLLIVLLLLGGAFGAGFALFNMNKPAAEVTVAAPSVSGLTLEEAKSRLKDRNLKVAKIGEEYSETVDEGKIISQAPLESTQVKPGSVISVVLSKGQPFVDTPNVIGETSANATSMMMKTGLEPSGNNVYEYSDSIPMDRVISQTPESSESVRKGTSFTLTISKGPETVQLPDVYNKPEKEAKLALEQVGVNVVKKDDFDDSVPTGIVIRTAPPAGTTVDVGSTVTMVVSKGVDMVIVPNVFGKTERQAKDIIERAGLKPKFEYIPNAGMPGRSFNQSPQPGEEVKRNTEVIVYMGEANLPGKKNGNGN